MNIQQPIKLKIFPQQGFTLIELLVAISIIGILAALAVANYGSSQARARDASRKNDLKIVREALELYKIDSANAAYPSTTSYSAMTTTLGASNYLKSPYPQDPRNTGVFTYRYTGVSGGASYTLETCLENSNDPQQLSPVASPCTAANPNYRVTNP